MSTPLTPNFNPTTNPGRLATDRYDFQRHIDGYAFRHKADQIDLSPLITIDGYVKSNVQEAIAAISAALTPPIIPDATTISKGIIQLSGDLSGTATNVIVTQLRGKPVSALSPSLNDVLTWNGSSWGPSAAINSFTAAGDLSGTNTLQTVINLSGNAGLLTVSCDTIRFNSTVANPTITQASTSLAAGDNISIMGQNSSLASAKGGDIIISSGSPGLGGLRGSVKLQLDSGNTNLLQATEVAINRRVLSLVNQTDLTISEMPVGTGDMVIYIKDAVTPPVAGSSPVNGSILYSNSGKLYVTQSDGNNFALGEIPNPSIWGSLSASPQSGQVKTYRLMGISTSGAQTSLGSFTVENKTSIKFDAVIVGKQDNSSESAQFNLSIGFARQDTAVPPVQDIGVITSTDSRTTSGAAGWTVPIISRIGNTVTVYSGANAATTIYWFVVLQMTTSQSLT